MKIENEFIPYEQAIALKELGFDEDCFSDYFSFNNVNQTLEDDIQLILNEESIDNYCEENDLYPFHICSAPLYQQAFRWFREKYNLWNMIYPRDGWNYSINRVDETTSCSGESFHSVEINEYEETELECLKKLIEIVKSQK